MLVILLNLHRRTPIKSYRRETRDKVSDMELVQYGDLAVDATPQHTSTSHM